MLLAKRSESHLFSSLCVCVSVYMCGCMQREQHFLLLCEKCVHHTLTSRLCSCIFALVLHAVPLFKPSSSLDRIPQRYFICLNAAVPLHETFFEVWQNRSIVRHAACTSICLVNHGINTNNNMITASLLSCGAGKITFTIPFMLIVLLAK